MKHLIKSLVLNICIISLLSTCSGVRTDGYMSFKGYGFKMIYFNTHNPDYIFNKLQEDFGVYTIGGKYSDEFIWENFTNEVWSDELLEMKVITNKINKKTSSISIAIVSETGDVLTSKSSTSFKHIKEYFLNLRLQKI